MATYCTHRPRQYAQGKLSTMLSRWNGAAGQYVREYGPLIWPDVPPEALMAFSANSTGSTEAITDAGFWEIGLYNTPAGSPSQPAATGGAWASIARGDTFRQLVGRSGVTGSGWQTAIEDQVVIGLLDYRNGIANVANRIPQDVRPASPPSTQWAWACGAFGYVSSTGAVIAINEHLAQVRAVTEQWRFGALLAATAESGFSRQTAYPMVRAWQRLECGRLLAERTGGDVGWFDLGLGQYTDAVEHRITMAYYGDPDCALQPGAEGAVGMEIPAGGKALLIVGGLLGLAWAGWEFSRSRRRR